MTKHYRAERATDAMTISRKKQGKQRRVARRATPAALRSRHFAEEDTGEAMVRPPATTGRPKRAENAVAQSTHVNDPSNIMALINAIEHTTRPEPAAAATTNDTDDGYVIVTAPVQHRLTENDFVVIG